MPMNAYGVYEPDGMSIWINEDIQGAVATTKNGVIGHEFMHYIHSISTVYGIDDLLTLLFQVHAVGRKKISIDRYTSNIILTVKYYLYIIRYSICDNIYNGTL